MGNGSSSQQLKAKMGHLSGELRWGSETPRSPCQVTVLELPYVHSWKQLAPNLFNRGVKLETIKSYLTGINYMKPQRIQPYFFYSLSCFNFNGLGFWVGFFVLQTHVLLHWYCAKIVFQMLWERKIFTTSLDYFFFFLNRDNNHL